MAIRGMSLLSSKPTWVQDVPPSVERYIPSPQEEEFRPFPSPVPTQTIFALPCLIRFSLAIGAVGSAFHPAQSAGASATATEPIEEVSCLSKTGVNVVPRFVVF